MSNGSNKATRALIGEYSMREPTPTPLRTPRYTDKLMTQALDNIALSSQQTPLIGGKNPTLQQNTRLQSLKPQKTIASTPNVLHN